MLKKKISNIFTLLLLIPLLYCCNTVSAPKPRGYFRIDLPDKYYMSTDSSTGRAKLPFSFEYPVYGRFSFDESTGEPGWFNIDFPQNKAKLYLTYLNVNNDLDKLLESSYKLNVKNHIIKADAIDEQLIYYPDKRIYGILYDLKGNTATAVQFFVTDSVRNFFRGSLYFDTEPNQDSLAPVIRFFREDITHLIETFKWTNTVNDI